VAYERQRLPMTAGHRRLQPPWAAPKGVIDCGRADRARRGFTDVDTILNYEAREAIVARLRSKGRLCRPPWWRDK